MWCLYAWFRPGRSPLYSLCFLLLSYILPCTILRHFDWLIKALCWYIRAEAAYAPDYYVLLWKLKRNIAVTINLDSNAGHRHNICHTSLGCDTVHIKHQTSSWYCFLDWVTLSSSVPRGVWNIDLTSAVSCLNSLGWTSTVLVLFGSTFASKVLMWYWFCIRKRNASWHLGDRAILVLLILYSFF